MKFFIKSILFLIVIFPLFNPHEASACSCMAQGATNQQALEYADAVFAGKVMKITGTEETTKQITFDVSKTWKGENSNTLIVSTPGNSAACGWSPVIGSEYLVYAHQSEAASQDHGLNIGLCDRTFLLAEAANDLQALGQGKSTSQVQPPIKSNTNPVDIQNEEQGSAEVETSIPERQNNTPFIILGLILVGLGYVLYKNRR